MADNKHQKNQNPNQNQNQDQKREPQRQPQGGQGMERDSDRNDVKPNADKMTEQGGQGDMNRQKQSNKGQGQVQGAKGSVDGDLDADDMEQGEAQDGDDEARITQRNPAQKK